MKKKIFSLAAAIMLFSAISMAQGPQGGPSKGGQNDSQFIEQMISDLELDKSQAAQFRDVMKEMQQNDKGKGGPNGGMGQKQEDMQSKMDEINKKVKKILTKKQYKKYEKLISQSSSKK